MRRTSPLQKAFNVNSTATAFATLIPTVTEPVSVRSGEVASGIFDLVPGGRGLVQDTVLVGFFGAGADNATFDARLWGWDRIGSDPATTLWVPRILASFTCTLSTMVGIAGAKIINTDRFADTLVVNAVAPQPFFPGVNATPAAEFGGSIKVFSPANNFMAWAEVPLMGCEKLQFDFDSTGSTDSNAVFRLLNDED
jgi:hypothetical protein